MADAKITDLADGGSVVATDEFVIARAGDNKKIAGKYLPGAELDYVERNTALTVSATTAAGANTFIDGTAVTYDGSTRIKVEFFCPFGAGNNFLAVDLWDGSTDLGVIAQINTTSNGLPVYGVMFLTPSNASHTFHIKAWRGTTSGDLDPAAGGAGTRIPAFLRITKA